MNELPLNQVILGDCTEVMKAWPADSIDLVVTSPPYWGLRDYGDETVRVWGGDPECRHEWNNYVFQKRGHPGDKSTLVGTQTAPLSKSIGGTTTNTCVECGAWRGSLGLEPHPQMFVDHLVEICREIRRVLKPSGTFWLNLGDTYYGSHAGKIPQAKNPNVKIPEPPSSIAKGNWLQPKQKLMMPSRVAIALQHDGWILRNDIIWHKPNHMPSSVKDRLTTAYEHIFLFVKNNESIYWIDKFTGKLSSLKPDQYYVHDETGKKRFYRPKKEVDKDWFDVNGPPLFSYAWQGHTYYFDLDAIRKPFSEGTFLRIRQPNIDNQPGGPKTLSLRGESPESGNASRPIDMAQELSRKIASGEITGKNPGDVWEIDKPIISNSRKELHGPTYRRHQIKIKGGQAIGLHPLGKNPGDVLSGSKYLEQDHPHSIRVKGGHTGDYTHPRGKNPGDLWRISTHPFPAAHFATFPPTLIEPIIKAGSPRWICSRCGKPRIRIREPTPEYAKKLGKSVHNHKDDLKRGMRYDKVYNAEYVTTGWSDCGCGEGWNPGVVLDPFCGSGTALRVARRLGRRFIGIDIVPEYVEMAHRRIRGDKYREPPKGVVQLDQFMEAEE